MRISILFLLLGIQLSAQTNISGVINDYSVVNDIMNTECASEITVDEPASFSIGDRVLLIQMKGATIDSSNSIAFGDIVDLNGAGNWEFANITDIMGEVISLDGAIQRNFDLDGRLQLVRVPVYENANVVGELTAPAWDGETGGVLVLWVENTLTLNADINLDGKGFRGGVISNNPDGGCGTGSPDYYYPLDQPGAVWMSGGAEKGEGIAEISEEKRAGRGPLATGGGGGNKHNTGGGGGSNFTRGGKGGNELQGCFLDERGGLGGNQLFSAYQDDRLFLGGGGGRGDDNNMVGSIGEDGGGLVMVVANTLSGNGFNIQSNGISQNNPGTGIADGGGGGGAGGSLWLQVENYSGTLNLIANGGDGGDQEPTFGCVGTGGGGGAGAMVTSGPLPADVTWALEPGNAGVFTAVGYSCSGSTYGASNGQGLSFSYINANNIYFASALGSTVVDLGPDTILCDGDFIVLSGPDDVDSYLWQDGSDMQTFSVTQSDEYWLEVSLGECFAADTVQVEVLPSTKVDLGLDSIFCREDLPYILQTGNGLGVNYLWQDGSTANSFTVSGEGIYAVEASIGECVSRDSVAISIRSCIDCNFYVPNVFSPDFDGINDGFGWFSNCLPLNFEMKIFDRWGELVFRTSDSGDYWDGFIGSLAAETGVYVYLIDVLVEETDGVNTYALTGDVTLLR